MKRSKMIEMIRQKLIGTAINGPVINAISPEFPEQILMLVEELGMVPPECEVGYRWERDDD